MDSRLRPRRKFRKIELLLEVLELLISRTDNVPNADQFVHAGSARWLSHQSTQTSCRLHTELTISDLGVMLCSTTNLSDKHATAIKQCAVIRNRDRWISLALEEPSNCVVLERHLVVHGECPPVF